MNQVITMDNKAYKRLSDEAWWILSNETRHFDLGGGQTVEMPQPLPTREHLIAIAMALKDVEEREKRAISALSSAQVLVQGYALIAQESGVALPPVTISACREIDDTLAAMKGAAL